MPNCTNSQKYWSMMFARWERRMKEISEYFFLDFLKAKTSEKRVYCSTKENVELTILTKMKWRPFWKSNLKKREWLYSPSGWLERVGVPAHFLLMLNLCSLFRQMKRANHRKSCSSVPNVSIEKMDRMMPASHVAESGNLCKFGMEQPAGPVVVRLQ